MTKVTDRLAAEADRPVVICDFSPPRGATPDLLDAARSLRADFLSVAYNPGKSTRVSSPFVAQWLKANTSSDVTFTLATRDMNALALQSLVLGAQLAGLENVVVVRGDRFTARELSLVRDVDDLRPTGLIASIARMNQGIDFKGLKLRAPTDVCIGATIDMGRGDETEIPLTRRKADAGAHFFLSQPTFGPERPRQFLATYAERYGEELSPPIFYGVQIMSPESITFGDVPEWVTSDLAAGRSGTEVALQVVSEFDSAGLRSIYLVPPILKGGRRDYEAARAVLESLGS